MRDIRDVL